MRVAVWNVGKWLPSKFTSGECRRVSFKGLDDNKTYYLNLDTTHEGYDRWQPFIKEGNVLDAQVPQGSKNINKFGQFTVIKEVQNDSVQINI